MIDLVEDIVWAWLVTSLFATALWIVWRAPVKKP